MLGSTNAITPQGYDFFRTYLEKVCGIMLSDNKQYLVASRLGKILERENITKLEDLVTVLTKTNNSSLKEEVINAMTTNETLWFRDTHPFNILKNVILPEKGKSAPLRIWSAAASTGQEAYSISMILDEFRTQSSSPYKTSDKIIATDICTNILAHAKQAEYDHLAIARGLTESLQQKYFDKLDNGSWKIKPNIRNRVEFKYLNLIDSYSGLGKFDIVFCRNVLIYFSTELKLEILSKIHKTLNPGGYLFLGGSEALSGMTSMYEIIQCHPGIVYRAK